MEKETLESQYAKVFEQSSATHPIFPLAARYQMAQLVEAIARSKSNITQILSTSQTVPVKGGFLAEEFHAETFNLDAILKADKARAYTDRYDEWNSLQWNGRNLSRNDVPDIAVTRDGNVSTTLQSKYNYSAETTAREMSQVKNGHPKYGAVDSLLGPEDQVNRTYRSVPGETEPVGTTTIGEHAQAKAEALIKEGGNEAEVQAYQQTAKKVTDTVRDGKSSSTSLTKGEADAMGAGDMTKLRKVEEQYQTRSTGGMMVGAAVGAAAMSAIVCGAVNTVRYIQLAREGKLTGEQAALKILGETAASAADSAVKASANTGVQSLLVRYGSEKASLQFLANQSFAGMLLRTNMATIGVVCVVDAVKDLVLLGTGKISKDTFFERQGKGILTTSAGTVGGTLGVAGATSFAGLLGGGSTAMAAASLIGGLSGGIIGGLAMALAIENGIEKPYRDLVENTQNLRAAAEELDRVSQNIFMGQCYFNKYLQQDNALEEALNMQFSRIDEAQKRALDAISKI